MRSSGDDAPDRDPRGLLYLPELEVVEQPEEVVEAAREELLEEVAFRNENAGPCPYPKARSIMDPWLELKIGRFLEHLWEFL